MKTHLTKSTYGKALPMFRNDPSSMGYADNPDKAFLASPPQFLKLLMDPWGQKPMTIPDTDCTPCHIKTVYTTAELTGNTEMVFMWRPSHAGRDTLLTFKPVIHPDTGTPTLGLVAGIYPDEDMSLAYQARRPIAGGLSLVSSTVSSGMNDLSGQFTACVLHNLPDFRNFDATKLTAYNKDDGILQSVGVKDGVTALYVPEGDQGFRPVKTDAVWLGQNCGRFFFRSIGVPVGPYAAPNVIGANVVFDTSLGGVPKMPSLLGWLKLEGHMNCTVGAGTTVASVQLQVYYINGAGVSTAWITNNINFSLTGTDLSIPVQVDLTPGLLIDRIKITVNTAVGGVTLLPSANVSIVCDGLFQRNEHFPMHIITLRGFNATANLSVRGVMHYEAVPDTTLSKQIGQSEDRNTNTDELCLTNAFIRGDSRFRDNYSIPQWEAVLRWLDTTNRAELIGSASPLLLRKLWGGLKHLLPMLKPALTSLTSSLAPQFSPLVEGAFKSFGIANDLESSNFHRLGDLTKMSNQSIYGDAAELSTFSLPTTSKTQQTNPFEAIKRLAETYKMPAFIPPTTTTNAPTTSTISQFPATSQVQPTERQTHGTFISTLSAAKEVSKMNTIDFTSLIRTQNTASSMSLTEGVQSHIGKLPPSFGLFPATYGPAGSSATLVTVAITPLPIAKFRYQLLTDTVIGKSGSRHAYVAIDTVDPTDAVLTAIMTALDKHMVDEAFVTFYDLTEHVTAIRHTSFYAALRAALVGIPPRFIISGTHSMEDVFGAPGSVPVKQSLGLEYPYPRLFCDLETVETAENIGDYNSLDGAYSGIIDWNNSWSFHTMEDLISISCMTDALRISERKSQVLSSAKTAGLPTLLAQLQASLTPLGFNEATGELVTQDKDRPETFKNAARTLFNALKQKNKLWNESGAIINSSLPPSAFNNLMAKIQNTLLSLKGEVPKTSNDKTLFVFDAEKAKVPLPSPPSITNFKTNLDNARQEFSRLSDKTSPEFIFLETLLKLADSFTPVQIDKALSTKLGSPVFLKVLVMLEQAAKMFANRAKGKKTKAQKRKNKTAPPAPVSKPISQPVSQPLAEVEEKSEIITSDQTF